MSIKQLVNCQAGYYASALTSSLEQLLRRGESAGHFTNEIFTMAFELELSFD